MENDTDYFYPDHDDKNFSSNICLTKIILEINKSLVILANKLRTTEIPVKITKVLVISTRILIKMKSQLKVWQDGK